MLTDTADERNAIKTHWTSKAKNTHLKGMGKALPGLRNVEWSLRKEIPIQTRKFFDIQGGPFFPHDAYTHNWPYATILNFEICYI